MGINESIREAAIARVNAEEKEERSSFAWQMMEKIESVCPELKRRSEEKRLFRRQDKICRYMDEERRKHGRKMVESVSKRRAAR